MSAPIPPPSQRPAQANGPVAVIALLLATVPGCFMANYDDFLDAGLDARTLVDADGAGSSDEEASSGTTDTGPDDLDANILPDAKAEQDGGMDASDADPPTMDSTIDGGADSRVNPGSDGGPDATADADAGRDASDARTDAESGADGATDGGDASDTSTPADADAGDAALPCQVAGCVQTCGANQTCTYTCAAGNYCNFDCRGAMLCTVVCKAGSHCEVRSSGPDKDIIDCEANAKCGRTCGSESECLFEPCSGSFYRCADAGNRCNWTCPGP